MEPLCKSFQKLHKYLKLSVNSSIKRRENLKSMSFISTQKSGINSISYVKHVFSDFREVYYFL